MGWVRLPLALLAAAALTACGGDGAPETRTAPPAVPSAPETREPVRAAPPAEELRADPTAVLQHALDVLLSGESDDDARDAAIDVVVAAGPAGADAVAPWLALGSDDRNSEAAHDALVRLGDDAVPVVLRRLRGTPTPVERAGLLRVLRSAWRWWTGTDLAPEVVAAAWAAAEAVDASQEDDFGARAAVVGVLSRAGADARRQVDALIERVAAHPDGPWLDAISGSDDDFHSADVEGSVGLLLGMLARAEAREFAAHCLEHVALPPRESAGELLALLYDAAADEGGRAAALELAARWSGRLPDLAPTVGRFLATGTPDERASVLAGLGADDAGPWSDDVLAAAFRLVVDEDASVADAARDAASVFAARSERAPELLAAALRGAEPDLAARLWAVAVDVPEDRRAALVEIALAHFAAPYAPRRLGALTFADSVSESDRERVAQAAVPLLADEDPGVRAWAASVASWGESPPWDRILVGAVRLATQIRDEDDRRALRGALGRLEGPLAEAGALSLLPVAEGDLFDWALDRVTAAGSVVESPDAVARLVRGLDEANAWARCAAVLLRRADDAGPAVERVGAALQSGDDDEFRAALGAIDSAGRAAAPLVPALERILDPEDRCAEAAVSLAFLRGDPPAAARRLGGFLSSEQDSSRRERIGSLLLRLGPDGARAFVVADTPGWALHDTARELAEREPGAVLDAVTALVASPSAGDRVRAAKRLDLLAPADAVSRWSRLLADPDSAVRRAAAEADLPEGVDRDTVARSLAALLRDGEAVCRLRAAQALVFARELRPEDADALRALRTDEDRDVRATAAAALVLQEARVEDPVPALLLPFTGSDRIDWSVADDCARALQRLGPRTASAAPVLGRALIRSGDESTQLYLVQALGTLGPDAAPCVPALRLALALELPRDSCVTAFRSDIRAAAIETLGAIGPKAAAALPDLRRYVGDSELGKAARAAIAKIEAK